MTYRILSLDGGGIWALVQIKALISLYNNDQNTSGHTVLKDFDLVAANSAGSIVLGGLLENLTLGGILALFEETTNRKAIFSLAGLSDVILHDLSENLAVFVPKDSNLNLTGVVPKYSARNKLSALLRLFPNKGNISLSEVTAGIHRPGSKNVHLLIAGFDYDLDRAVFFRSSKVSGPQWGKGEAADVTLCEAIHASTNAPVKYFDAPAQFPNGKGRRYWDGAIAGCNNPILAAVTEAIGMNHTSANIAALSIGTASVVLPRQNGQHPLPYAQPTLGPGIVFDVRKLATSIIDDPPDGATFLAYVMTGGGKGAKPPTHSRVVRMNPLISPVKKGKTWVLPDSMTSAEFNYLANLELDAIEQQQVDAIARYADLWIKNIAPNQAIRMNGETLKPELGQDRFAAAVAAWNSIK